jgi:hypothetical protein
MIQPLEQLKCPRCKNIFKKPVQYQVLGMMSADSNYVVMGESDALPCPACGYRMAKQDVIRGKFDTVFQSNFHRTEAFYSGVATAAVILVLLYFYWR